MVSAILLALSLVLTFYVAKFTLHWTLLLLGARHKSILIFSVFYILFVYSLITAAIYIPPQPKALLVGTVRFIDELTTTVNTGISNIFTNLPTVTSGTASEAFCSANPGSQYISVFLRDRPWWSSQNSREHIAPRGAILKIQGKIVNEDGLWFEVLAGDDSRRYVNAEICLTDVDVNTISDISADSILPPLSR